MQLLALGQAHFQFYSAFYEVQIERHQGVAFLLHFADELVNFFPVKKQCPATGRVRVDMRGGGLQRRNGRADQNNLLALHAHVSLFYLRPTRADGFNLPAFERHTGFVALLDKILMKCTFIINNTHGRSLGLDTYTVHQIVKSILVPYSAAEIFDLVNAVERYPEFMPWCGGATVHTRDDDALTASIVIDFHGIKQTFTTRNTNQRPGRIDVALVEGPFKSLVGHWKFHTLREDACKVVFELDYAFKNRALEAIVGPVFNKIANSFVDAFAKRAETIYGARI